MNVAGFPFRLQIYEDFLKGGGKNDENPVKLNANVCIAMQNVWEHKICEYDISA